MEVLEVKTGEVEGVFLVTQAGLIAERERVCPRHLGRSA